MPEFSNGAHAMRHSEFQDWAEETLGDRRQVYARDRRRQPNAQLVYMPEGAAQEFYKGAKAGHLICPVPSCPSPELSTRGPVSRRHHFWHVHAPRDPNHNPAYARLVVERLLYEWAIAQSSTVAALPQQDVGGVPITLLVRLANGALVGLCYVDYRLGADEWLRRHETLVAHDVADAWLFAPRRMFFAPADPVPGPSEPEDGVVRDRPIFRKMRGSSMWPLVINAERQEVAILIKPGGKPAQRLGLPSPVSPERVQHAVVSPLGRCGLTEDGIATPAISAYVLRLRRR